MYRPYNQQRRRRRPNMKLILLIAVVFLVIAVTAVVLILVPKKATNADNIAELPFQQGEQFAVTEGGVTYISGSSCVRLAEDMSSAWENVLYTSDMKLVCSDTLSCAYTEANLQTIDSAGVLLYLKTFSNIRSVRPGVTRVAVCCDVADAATGEPIPTIFCLDASGSELVSIPFSEQTVIDYGFYGGSELLWVLTLDASGSVPISNITTYNPGKTMTGTMTMMQLVERVVISEENIYAFGSTTLKSYTLFSESCNSFLVYGWRYVGSAFVKGQPVFICAPRNADGELSFSSLKLMSYDGASVSVNLPEDCVAACIYNSKLVTVSPSNIYVYSLTGQYENTVALPYTYDAVAQAAGGYIVLLKGSQYFAYPLGK